MRVRVRVRGMRGRGAGEGAGEGEGEGEAQAQAPPHRLDALDLESGHLELLDVPEERGGGVGAGEDVARHEEAPLRVLPVGALAQAGDLHVEEAVVLEHVAAVGEEELEVGDAHLRQIQGDVGRYREI